MESFLFTLQNLVVAACGMNKKSFLFFTNMCGEMEVCNSKLRYVTPKWAERVKRIGSGKRGEATGDWRNSRMRGIVI